MHTPAPPLDFLCDCLRVDLDPASEGRIRASIADPRFDWTSHIRLANRHHLAPALWAALAGRGLMQPVPPPLRAFLERTPPAGAVGRLPAAYLEDQYEANRKRNARIRTDLAETVHALNQRAIEPVIVKGGAWLLAPEGLDPAIRTMRDLDLLIAKPQLEEAVSALLDLGYRRIDTGMPPGHHHPPLLRDGAVASIELHWHLLAPQARAIFPTEHALQCALRCQMDGAVARILPPTERLLLNFLHAQLVDRAHRRHLLMLRDIHEFALLAWRFGSRVDWESAMARVRAEGSGHALESYLFLAGRLFGLSWPLPLPASGAARRHYARCRLKLALPRPIRLADSVLDQIAVGFSRTMIVERYGPPAGRRWLWRSRWRHLRNLQRKYRGKLIERLRGPTEDQP